MLNIKCSISQESVSYTHLKFYPYGSNSWLSIFMLFMPRIVWGYWEAVQARNMSLGANRTLKALRRN